MSKPVDIYSPVAKALKKLGVIDWDLRRPLSPAQKGTITRYYREWGHVVKHPEDFHAAKVGKKTKNALAEAGFLINKKGRAFIPKSGFSSVRIKDGKIIKSHPSGEKEITYLDRGADLDSRMRKLFAKKLAANQMVSFRVGDSAPFNTRFADYASANNYINKWQPKDPGADRESVIRLLSLVTVPWNPSHVKSHPKKKKWANKRGK